MLEICKLPGIKKYTSTSRAGFQPDMGLLFVKDLIHFDSTFRAINIIYFVKFLTDFFTSTIKDLISQPLLQHFFQHVGFAEQAKTILTAIDPYFMPVRHFVHFAKTLWTFHRLTLLQYLVLCVVLDDSSRRLSLEKLMGANALIKPSSEIGM